MTAEMIFATQGRRITFVDGEKEQTFKALIQPLRYKNKMYLDGIYTEIGFNSQGHYLYIGPPDPDLTAASKNSVITADGTSYRVDRAEKVYNGENVFYIWAIIRTIVEVE